MRWTAYACRPLVVLYVFIALSSTLLPRALAWAGAAAPQSSEPVTRVAIEQGRLSVDLREAPLASVLHLVGTRAGVPVVVRGRLAARITDAFQDVPLEDGLRRLLRGHSCVLFYGPSPELDGALVLTEVSVIGSSPATDVRLGTGAGGRQTRANDPAPWSPSARPGSSAPIPEAAPEADGPAASRATGGGVERVSRAARLQEIQELGQRRDVEGIAELARILQDDPHPLVRAQAAAFLGVPGSDEAATALGRALNDPVASVRLHAARALGKAEGAGALPALEKVAASDPDPRVRRVAVRWLGALPGEEARTSLLAAGADPDESVRQEAAEALKRRDKEVRPTSVR